MASIVGINWGSSAFRAYLLSKDGVVHDEHISKNGISGLDRDGIERALHDAIGGWSNIEGIYASGMIGSNIGWIEAPYTECAASPEILSSAIVATKIGTYQVRIIPGVACTRADGAPDILRGEETEIFGALALDRSSGLKDLPHGLMLLPGTHTKWCRISGNCLLDFFTAMNGEIYDRLTTMGLLASVVEGQAEIGDAFERGVARGRTSGLNLGTALFEVRAMVIRKLMSKSDAASYLRGLLIGSEIADAVNIYGDAIGPAARPMPIVGNAPLGRLYAHALNAIGQATITVDARTAYVAGLLAIDRLSVSSANV
jgi:2-dehydro-3-deoxygalactonokinase